MALQQMKPDTLQQAVARQYGQVAVQPAGQFPFPVGRGFAERLGYAPDLLDTLPETAVARFTGISNPLVFADLQPGETVIDLGCGAGMDLILSARGVGENGRAIGIDLAPEMVDVARTHTAELPQVEVRLAAADDLPIDDNNVDAVVVNGIFNLCPSKEKVATEIWRVLKENGRLLASEIVLPMTDDEAAQFQTYSLGDASSPEDALAKWFS
jgi:SAM-dependent methyltransferase